jgi:beta-glucosidase
MVTETGDIIVPAGRYAVSIGGGQPGSGLPFLTGKFSIAGQMHLPE